MEGSKAFSLSKTDLLKIGKGLLIALAGAALTYLADMIPQVDFGTWTPMAVAGFSFLINAGQKYLLDTRSV